MELIIKINIMWHNKQFMSNKETPAWTAQEIAIAQKAESLRDSGKLPAR